MFHWGVVGARRGGALGALSLGPRHVTGAIGRGIGG